MPPTACYASTSSPQPRDNFPGVAKNLADDLKKDFKFDIEITNKHLALKLPVQSTSSIWAAIQFNYGCCGVNDHSAYADFNWSKVICIDHASSNICFLAK